MKLTINLIIFFIMISTSKLMSADFKDEANPTVQEVVNKSTEAESPTSSEDMNSEDLAAEFLNEIGVSEGENGDLYIAVGTSQMPEEDPATNPDFLTLREIKANEAALEAKKMFIEYVRTEISASDMVTIPATPLGTEFDNKKNAVTEKEQVDEFPAKSVAVYSKT